MRAITDRQTEIHRKMNRDKQIKASTQTVRRYKSRAYCAGPLSLPLAHATPRTSFREASVFRSVSIVGFL